MMVEVRAAYPRTVLGFDFGHRRIGVAVGQELTLTAQPIATLPVRKQQPDWEALGHIVFDWNPALLVVGIPRHADGSPNAVTSAALRFSQQLNSRYNLPVETIDERLSSLEAKSVMINLRRSRQRNVKEVVDRAAAALILESWFTQQRTDSIAKNRKIASEDGS